MSKVFGTIAAVFLAASAFVAWKNQEAYKGEIKTYQTEQAEEKSTIKELNKQQTRLADADAAKQGYITKTAEVQTKLDGVNADLEKAKEVVDGLKEDHKNKEAEIANANDILKDLPNPKELVPKIKRMRSELAEATSGIATEEARLANLTRQDQNGKQRIKETRELIRLQTTGKSFPTLKTRISSIYRNWGFVILSAGDKQGVVSGSTLDVMRGGEVVGKLKVTAVEAGRASADIILDSVAEGTTLQAGDTVVAERAAAE
ncbi:MAG: hypothetical protein H7A51_01900 [Akkermansiaceae bacterium]|nr:hypothetical protein [Akkermansiaceae bacterium]